MQKDNVQKFLERVQLEKEADQLLKQSLNTDESSINHLLNNKTNRYATGKLEQYKVLLNTCKFKLVVYFKVDKWNREYTIQEKMYNKHRRFIPSVDRVNHSINEELSFNTLIDYCLKNASRLDAAQIYLIDRVNQEELQVFKFNAANVAASDYRHMEFKNSIQGSRFFIKMIDEPIRTDKIRSK